MSEYISKRQRKLNVGIYSYTENQTVLDVIGDVNIVGIVTATNFVGSLIGTASSSLFSSVAEISTYAVNAGVSTNVIGGIGSISSLNVSGISTSAEFIGGGSDLRNISGTHLVSYASASEVSNSALSISGVSGYSEVGILTGTYAVDGSDRFGWSVATSADGKTIVVGARNDEVPGSSSASGVVYVYDRIGNSFNQVGILTGTYAVDGFEHFGISVATSADGKTIVVGAWYDEVPGSSDTGVVYVYDRIGNSFNQVGILTGTYAVDDYDDFGYSVAISADGKTIVVGARNDEVPGSGFDSGVAYVYDRIGNSFNQVGILTGTYVNSYDSFGLSVATSADGKTIIVGAIFDEVPGSGSASGVVYVYDRIEDSFNQVGILTGTYAVDSVDLFGTSVATSADGKTIVVSTYSDEVPGSGTSSGVVYVYDRIEDSFNQVGILTGTYAVDDYDYFGQSVAISADGKTIVVGAYTDEVPGSGSSSDSGVAYVYKRIGNSFNQVGILTGTYAVDISDYFGNSVATSADGKTIVVGARGDEVPGSGSGSGVAYVYDELRETYVYSDSSGNIGIGTQFPRTKLDVIGNANISGVTTTQNINVGTGGTILVTQSGNVGIGSTLPQYKLDVQGDGQVTGTLFVGDIISRGTSTEEIVRTSSGILTTINTNPITIDQFDVNSFRSAKYLVQVTTKNSLGLGTTISVKNLSGGSDYFPGVYSDKLLTAVNGIGTGGRATVTVSPQFTLTPTSCIGGTFTISGSTAGINTGQTIYFNEELSILPLEQSKLTQIQLNSSGFGYTSIPSVTIQAPIISSNPVPGVGTGATATAAVNSMIVQDFPVTVGIATTAYPTVTISSPTSGTTATGVVGVGVSTLSIVNVGSGYTVSPTISIAKASGFSGSVGLGISTLNWQTSGGSGFTTTPTITITGENNIGVGASIEADVDPNSPNGLINFRITNVGSGYTAVPSVAITGDGVGAAVTITSMIVTDVTVNNSGSGSTTTISNSDIVFSPVGGIGTGAVASVDTIIPTNVVVTNVGSGYTSADIPVTATFSDPSIEAIVSLGVESISLLTTGIGYIVFPSITFASPTLGIGSTATASSTKLGYDLTTLFPGPGLGVTTAVYYIQPVTNNTFVISQTKNGQPITLGYTVKSTTRVSVGGSVTSVNITDSGSGYESNDVLTVLNLDSPRPDVNVGVGFSFQVNNIVNNFQVSDLLVLQTADTGNPASYVVESSGIADVIDLGDFTSDISGSNSRLIFNPKYSFNTIKYYRTTFTV